MRASIMPSGRRTGSTGRAVRRADGHRAMDRSTTSTEPPPSGTPEPHERPGLRSLRDLDVRVFSSASDAPRARRPTDVVLGALALLTIGGMTLVAPGPGALDTATQRFVQELPGLFGWF